MRVIGRPTRPRKSCLHIPTPTRPRRRASPQTAETGAWHADQTAYRAGAGRQIRQPIKQPPEKINGENRKEKHKN